VLTLRRQLVLKGVLLNAAQFCLQRGISPPQLAQLERQRTFFAVTVNRKRYFPAVLADRSIDRRRLEKLMRRLTPHVPAMVRFDLLASRRGSLGGKTVLQAMRRGKRYRMALRLADSLANEYRRGANHGKRRRGIARRIGV
jgi:hypothetical protein